MFYKTPCMSKTKPSRIFKWKGRKADYWLQCCGSGSKSVGSICFWASRVRIRICWSVVRIRVRIRLRILLSSSKHSKQNLDSYCFVTSFWLLTFEKWCLYLLKEISRKTFLLAYWRSMTKITGSGSIGQRHGSADPDPYQNVIAPQHWLIDM